MNELELKKLRLINRLRNLDELDSEELLTINQYENKLILDMIDLSREEMEYLYYLTDKYHEQLSALV